MSLLTLITGKQDDPTALAAGIEQYIAEQIAAAKADMAALLAQANTDATAREAQLFAGVTQALGEVKAAVAPFANLAGRLDGAKIVIQLGDEKP